MFKKLINIKKQNTIHPPGQIVTEKFPVLTFGETPHIELSQWSFTISGLVKNKIKLNWDQFVQLPKSKVTSEFHCVTKWSRMKNIWEGVALNDLLKIANPLPKAHFALIHCFGDYTTNLSTKCLLDDDVILAYMHDNKPLHKDHGGPLRLVVPKRYGWKSAKWIKEIELINDNKPGFWESRGYHMHGDPWQEQRFS